jgi:hypothetical protein
LSIPDPWIIDIWCAGGPVNPGTRPLAMWERAMVME